MAYPRWLLLLPRPHRHGFLYIWQHGNGSGSRDHQETIRHPTKLTTSEVEIEFAQTHTSVEKGAGLYLTFDEFGRNAAIPLK